MDKSRSLHINELAPPEPIENVEYGPESTLIFTNREAKATWPLDPAVLAFFKRQVALEAQAIGYGSPYTLMMWQEEDGRWSVVVPWSEP